MGVDEAYLLAVKVQILDLVGSPLLRQPSVWSGPVKLALILFDENFNEISFTHTTREKQFLLKSE